MEQNFSRYIWAHTRRQQIWILVIVALSMLPYYLALNLPKLIVNGPIMGEGFETPGATQPFMPTTIPLPGIGDVTLFGTLQLGRLDTLIGLSLLFLALVIVNGSFKYYINIYKGLLGERLLRRFRYDLVDRVLRFPPRAFRHIRGAEVASMVKDEVEPLGGFTGDAFVQPALLGGQALTALAFIFVQNVWLGLVAAVMAGLQFAIIPALRRRLIELGRERQLTARQLSGRVGEIVDGITTIHVNDTSNYERADIASRLGRIFVIRYDIYKRKFMVKFLNNFLAQLTPFFFYMIGGYFTIQGSLDVGQLVAVINAYKELPGPLKELIDWDLMRQDVQVKYEQVVEQFDRADMIDAGLQQIDPSGGALLDDGLVVTGLTVATEDGARVLDHVTFRLERGETVALLGDAGGGSDALAEALVRLVPPLSGRIAAGGQDLLALPHSVTGRRISYAASDPAFFHGSLGDNLLYGLKHAPVSVPLRQGLAASTHRRLVAEAHRSGNPDFDLGGDWVDLANTAALTDEGGLTQAMTDVLDVVDLTPQVIEFATYSTFDATARPDLAEGLVTLRHALRKELTERDLADLVVPFERGSYNTEARVVDNILFGVMVPDRQDPALLAEGTDYFNRTLVEQGLGAMLYDMGRRIADTALELFEGLPPDHPFFERLNFMDADDIALHQGLRKRLRRTPFERASPADRTAVIQLGFRYIEPRHRFGVLDEALMTRIVEVREAFHRDLPEHLRPLIELYDPDRYLSSGTLIDNVIFGRINHRFGDAERQIREIVEDLVPAYPGLYRGIVEVGLTYDLGASGRRLPLPQRQKLNLARALIRKSDFYVFNRPLTALDGAEREGITTRALAFLAAQNDRPGVAWVVETPDLARHFDRAVTFADQHIVEDGSDPAPEPDPAPDAPDGARDSGNHGGGDAGTGAASQKAGPTRADVVTSPRPAGLKEALSFDESDR